MSQLWTPRTKKDGNEARAASLTQRGTIALRFDYKGKGLLIEVAPALAVRMVADLSDCLDRLEFEARRQGEYSQFSKDVIA